MAPLVYAAWAKFTLFSCVIYALGTGLYLMARREHGQRPFLPYESLVCALLVLAGPAGLATGRRTV